MTLLLIPAALLAATLVTAAAADEAPDLDIRAMCRGAGQAGITDGDPVAGCRRSEEEARGTLRQRWAEFPAGARRQCDAEIRIGGTPPSYVELLTCLELASNKIGAGAGRPAPAADTGATTGTGGTPPTDVIAPGAENARKTR